MKDYQYYVSHLNFKEYEATNAFAYELMMRNEECQQCFKLLYRVIHKLNMKGKYFIDYIQPRYNNDAELKKYIQHRWEFDSKIDEIRHMDKSFLKTLSNLLFLYKGALGTEEWREFVLDYIEKRNDLDEYSIHSQFLDHIEDVDETELDHMIAVVGQFVLLNRYPETLSLPDNCSYKVGTFGFDLNNLLQKIKREKKPTLEKLLKIIEESIILEYEEIYRDYRKITRGLHRLNRLRERIEAFITKEFYIDFSKDLYLEYDFFSEKLHKELHKFYRGDLLPIFKKQKEQLSLDAEITKDGDEIVYNEVTLKTKEIFSLDATVFDQLDSIHTIESLREIISKDTNAYVFRYTKVDPVFSRPTLFSERFRDINLNFNPNLGKSELLSQFKAIIDAYQSNALQTKSIYEILGEEFKKWDKYIHRKKNSNSRQKTEIDSKQISTLVKNCQDILYIYDAAKNSIDNKTIAYTTKLGEVSVSSYLNFAKFLVEEKGFRFLLTTTP